MIFDIENGAISFKPINCFDKIKLILYPLVRNSKTHLKINLIMCKLSMDDLRTRPHYHIAMIHVPIRLLSLISLGLACRSLSY